MHTAQFRAGAFELLQSSSLPNLSSRLTAERRMKRTMVRGKKAAVRAHHVFRFEEFRSYWNSKCVKSRSTVRKTAELEDAHKQTHDDKEIIERKMYAEML